MVNQSCSTAKVDEGRARVSGSSLRYSDLMSAGGCVQQRPLASRMLPPLYIPFLLVATVISTLAALGGSMSMLVLATWFSVAIGGYILLHDSLIMWRQGGIVGRLTINFGVFYWFWMGAWHWAGHDPPFPKPHTLYPGFWGGVPPEVVGISLVCINLFALMALIGWRHIPQPKRLIMRLADRLDPKYTTWLDLVALGLVLLAWLSIFIAYRGDLITAIQDMLLVRATRKTGPAQNIGLLHNLHLLGVFGGALALARFVLKSPGLKVARYMAIGLMAFILFFGEGSRFNFSFLLLPAALILRAPVRHRLRWSKRRKTLTTIVLVGALLIMYQGAIRTHGLTESLEREIKLSSGFFGHDHFEAMMIAVDFANEKGFYMEAMIPYFVTHFVPRSIWPNKPYPQSWLDYNYECTQGGTFNVTPSITGQYYVNWGVAGVLYIGLFIGWLARLCECWFARLDIQRQLMSATVAGLLLGFVFLSFRFFYPLYFSYPMFGFFAYWLLTRRGSLL